MNPEFKPKFELSNKASLLERQQARMKWQPQQQQQCFFNGNDHHNDIQNMFTSGLDIVKPENWAGFGDVTYGDQFGFGYMKTQVGVDQSFVQGNSGSVSVSPKKRKAVDKSQSLQVYSIYMIFVKFLKKYICFIKF